MRVLFILLAIASIQCSLSAQVVHADLKAVDLRTEYRVNPLGIDDLRPRLFWRVTSDQRGQKQTAYRIIVASTPDGLTQRRADLWDSGRVASADTIHIEYAGKALTSRQQCFWAVKVWDRDGKASAWSKPASWSMGLLTEDDWSASYISYRDDTPVFKDRGSLFLPSAEVLPQGVYCQEKGFAERPSMLRRSVSTNWKSTATGLAMRTSLPVGRTTASEPTTTRTT